MTICPPNTYECALIRHDVRFPLNIYLIRFPLRTTCGLCHSCDLKRPITLQVKLFSLKVAKSHEIRARIQVIIVSVVLFRDVRR